MLLDSTLAADAVAGTLSWFYFIESELKHGPIGPRLCATIILKQLLLEIGARRPFPSWRLLEIVTALKFEKSSCLDFMLQACHQD